MVSRGSSVSAPLERPSVAVALQGTPLLIRAWLPCEPLVDCLQREAVVRHQWRLRMAEEALGRVLKPRYALERHPEALAERVELPVLRPLQ